MRKAKAHSARSDLGVDLSISHLQTVLRETGRERIVMLVDNRYLLSLVSALKIKGK